MIGALVSPVGESQTAVMRRIGKFNKQGVYADATRSDVRMIEPFTKHGPHDLLQFFNLECPDIKFIEPIIYRIVTGRVIDNLVVFDLDTPDPEDSVDNIIALAVYAFDFCRRFNKAETNSVSNCPLVFDTWVSTCISPFKSDFKDDY